MAAAARFDVARVGSEVIRPSQRQATWMIIAGRVFAENGPRVIKQIPTEPEPRVGYFQGSLRDLRRLFFKTTHHTGRQPGNPVDNLCARVPARPEALLMQSFHTRKNSPTNAAALAGATEHDVTGSASTLLA